MRKSAPLLAPLVLVVLAATLASCEHRKYEIVMSSHDGVLERTLIVTLMSDSNAKLPADEVATIGKLYQKTEANADGRSAVFTGKFTGRTPDDIGGAGFHSYVETPLGSVTAYIERFRGNDDILDQMETRTKAADRLVDLLAGWLKTQVGGEKDFDKLQAFLDKDLRRDLKNVSLYFWIATNDLVRVENPEANGAGVTFVVKPDTQPATHPATGIATKAAPTHPAEDRTITVTGGTAELHIGGNRADEGAPAMLKENREELAARIYQYLMEKGYLQAQDVPLLYKIQNGGGADATYARDAAGAMIGKILAGKAGIGNQALIGRVVSMVTTDANAAKASISDYLRQTDEYKKMLATWKAEPNRDPNASAPDPMDVLGDYASDWFGLELDGTDNDALNIRFSCPVAPVWTNGNWDAQARCIVWASTIRKSGDTARRLPTMCYAAWAAPNEEFQKRHFGGTVLKGDALMDYCLWYKALSPKEAAEWDAMVAALTPSPKMVETVNAFQFSTRPPVRPPAGPATRPAPGAIEGPAQTQPAQPAPDFYDKGKGMILNALQGSPATQPATAPARTGAGDGNALQTVIFRVAKSRDHLGHDIVRDEARGVDYHRHWYDGDRGTLTESHEDFIIYWDNGQISNPAFPLKEGKTYKLTFRGDIEKGIMGYEGKCIHVGKVATVEPVKD